MYRGQEARGGLQNDARESRGGLVRVPPAQDAPAPAAARVPVVHPQAALRAPIPAAGQTRSGVHLLLLPRAW